jgi:hypothetical protein
MTTGSLINNIWGDSQQPTPEVGMGATVLMWTDRTACTIVEVVNDKTIVVTADKATRTDDWGMSDAQSYLYETQPDGHRVTYTLRKNGAWIAQGQSMKNGNRLAIGIRNTYYDYSF